MDMEHPRYGPPHVTALWDMPPSELSQPGAVLSGILRFILVMGSRKPVAHRNVSTCCDQARAAFLHFSLV